MSVNSSFTLDNRLDATKKFGKVNKILRIRGFSQNLDVRGKNDIKELQVWNYEIGLNN